MTRVTILKLLGFPCAIIYMIAYILTFLLIPLLGWPLLLRKEIGEEESVEYKGQLAVAFIYAIIILFNQISYLVGAPLLIPCNTEYFFYNYCLIGLFLGLCKLWGEWSKYYDSKFNIKD